MILIPVTDGVWSAPSPLTVLGIIYLNTRMTFIRLKNGKLWVHSSIQWSEELDSELGQLGVIEYIIAPSCFHYMFIGPWKEHHPTAQICAPKGLKKKRTDLQIDHELQFEGQTRRLFKSMYFFIPPQKPLLSQICCSSYLIPPDSHRSMLGSMASKKSFRPLYCLQLQ